YTTKATNKIATIPGGLFVCYDGFCNPISSAPNQIPFSQQPVYVRGLSSLDGATFSDVPDTTPPILVFQQGPVGRVTELENHSFTFRVVALDQISAVDSSNPFAIQFRFSVNSGEFSAWTDQSVYRLASIPPGDYTLAVQARDQAGNIGSTNQTFTIPPQ